MAVASAYTAPVYGSPTARLHGWLLEAEAEGRGWLASQRPSRNWAAALALLSDDNLGPDSTDMSNTRYPKAKRMYRELVASLASFQHEGEYGVLWDNAFYDTAHLLTDLDRNWFKATHANLEYRKAIQIALAKGTSYVVTEWDRHYYGTYRGEIRQTAFDPADVTFVQLPRDGDIQKAYMVILKYEIPINLARRTYMSVNPGFANSLVPDQQSPSWVQKGLDVVQHFVSPALRVAGRGQQSRTDGSFPTVNIFHGYILDDSINMSPEPVQLGAFQTNWNYTVPALGDPLATGYNGPDGVALTRPAREEDCRLFPLRRLCIWSSNGVAYDGSSPWWHGEAPVAKLSFNDLPWEMLGGSAITDVKTMEEGIVALMRAMEDSAAARLDPAMLYDDTAVSESWALAVNPRKAGVRARAPLLSAGDPIKPLLPPQYYDVPQWIPNIIESYEARMDYLTGVKDVAAIAKARQIPGADTLEKLLEMAGPIVQDMIKALEMPLQRTGEWRKALFFQFYNGPRIIQTAGPEGYNPDEWDYIPEQMRQKVLDSFKHLPPEQRQQAASTGQYQLQPGMLMQNQSAAPEQRMQQTFKLISQFRYEITKSGVNELNRMTTKLFYLQLMKEGFPISWWTFAKIAEIPNFGPPPEGTNTEMERWIAQQHMKIELQGQLQKEALVAQAEAQQAIGGVPGMAPGGGGGPQMDSGGQVPPVPEPGEGNHRGRPQSYAAPPRMVQKDGGSRSTITTAKR